MTLDVSGLGEARGKAAPALGGEPVGRWGQGSGFRFRVVPVVVLVSVGLGLGSKHNDGGGNRVTVEAPESRM